MSTPEEIYNDAIRNWQCDMLDHLEYLRYSTHGTVLEIGVRTGNSTSAFLLTPGRPHVYSVDIYPECAHVLESPKWTFIHADSKDHLKVIEALGQSGMFDVLFIDGDHLYEGVKADLENYSPLVKPEGIIVLHDVINPEWPGVGRAFDEFVGRTGRKYEIHSGSYGLGVIYGCPNKYNPLFRPGNFEKL